ncbi:MULTISPECIES: sensor domain-containing protein [unclassified Streptomyces]|uniref:sensor domain-containing protein n=1 Tax=unclassified Streptomyces TaxID=2593676 RepID=UPI00224D30DF|nr:MULTISPECIES: sensor domain-containing protein [unclassified Streptomyces]WTB60975.1 sensor domain-containing protein [Streptomyces sp. NBC_00826]WTH96116.1 sensor domain-containing protein [Streptomyces sp. NBC_00825]WTI04861.1 sensor domain-containing protein [Streptomyces sp. NBC_00822]MCX4870500.1 sensor domain-containing protein [Streptomyces sp. NBC_00906]MCX4902023.1 sensor domain-containing protein [Streptomyces sp. NBC_00892]
MTHEAEPDQAGAQGAQPAPPPAGTRTRRLRPLALAAAVVLVALIGSVVWWRWPADDGPRVVAGTVQATVLTSREVSRTVGTTLNTETRMSEPAPSTQADPPGCSVAVGPATTVVYQRGWTAFLSVVHQDSDTVAEHTVTQTVGRYASGARAGEVFDALTDGINACTSAVRKAPGGDTSRWTYQVDSATAGALAWTATQEQGEGWACYREARLKASTVLQTAVCQAGDGRAASRTLADRMAGRVK